MRYWKSLNVGRSPKVGIVVAHYHTQGWLTASLVSSLLAQTYQNLHIFLVHDGPLPKGKVQAGELSFPLNADHKVDTKTVTVLESGPERLKVFGHNSRERGRQAALKAGCDIIGFTNGDNYYAPVFVEALASPMERGIKSELTYCNLIHSHRMWLPMDTRLARGHIDVGCWLARRAYVDQVAWDESKYVFHGDWLYLNQLLKLNPTVSKISGYLMTHN